MKLITKSKKIPVAVSMSVSEFVNYLKTFNAGVSGTVGGYDFTFYLKEDLVRLDGNTITLYPSSFSRN